MPAFAGRTATLLAGLTLTVLAGCAATIDTPTEEQLAGGHHNSPTDYSWPTGSDRGLSGCFNGFGGRC